MTAGRPQYKRILLKLSGEALQGTQGYGLDPAVLDSIARQVREVRALGVDVAMVVGGGNIFRGLPASQGRGMVPPPAASPSATARSRDRALPHSGRAVGGGMERATADYMGMLATVINGLALQDALEHVGVFTRVLSSIEMHQLCEPYIRRRAMRHLEKDRVIIFVGGTGNPYFTTDTTAALRAMEIGAEVILKATKVDGVYTADPATDRSAKKLDRLSFMDVLTRGLKVMDATAVSLCMDNHVPIIVFNLHQTGNIKRVVLGEPIGTVVDGGDSGRARVTRSGAPRRTAGSQGDGGHVGIRPTGHPPGPRTAVG